MTIELRLLGGFEATVDGVPVAPEQWTRRQAASLVKVLALAPGRRLHREQVIEALWPRASIEAAGPRLHKAAHYARRALGGDGSAVLLRNDMVALLPDSDVRVDVDEFRAARQPTRSRSVRRRRPTSRSRSTTDSCSPTTSTSPGPRMPATSCG